MTYTVYTNKTNTYSRQVGTYIWDIEKRRKQEEKEEGSGEKGKGKEEMGKLVRTEGQRSMHVEVRERVRAHG